MKPLKSNKECFGCKSLDVLELGRVDGEDVYQCMNCGRDWRIAAPDSRREK